ncbi:undecaprenyl/decaprenyl-phosphate alpha-N-acetylglucosaminyl 1-phosphate transferase [Cryomorphaceae bacterium]|nr:undecaprenyl/decaprenyl-phosphate alpha-N-acetylglucosaminyl 1-phosphate transferase [Cryomorphaceae bacterium]
MWWTSLLSSHAVAIISGLLALSLTAMSIPVIIRVARIKHLMDVPGERSSHSNKVPTLGGVGIFFGLSIALCIFASFQGSNELFVMLGALIILFFTGIKDDILVLAPITKFTTQIICAVVLTVLCDVRIEKFQGLLGIHELPYLVSVAFTVFVSVLIINAFNLIDGIDGLAGGIALIGTVFFGTYFYLDGDTDYVLLSSALIGSLLSFLWFNFSRRQKIFMGDTGSMIVGYLLAFLAVKFIQLNQSSESQIIVRNAPVIAISVLFFPLMDTLRVFIVRILNKKSPFEADKNHIHHRLLSLGLSHTQSSIMVYMFSLIVIGFSLYFNHNGIHTHLIMLLSFGILLSLIPFMIERKDGSIKISQLLQTDVKKEKEDDQVSH